MKIKTNRHIKQKYINVQRAMCMYMYVWLGKGETVVGEKYKITDKNMMQPTIGDIVKGHI